MSVNRVSQLTMAGVITSLSREGVSDRRSPRALLRSLTLASLLVLTVLSVGAASALAAEEAPTPWWGVTTGERPTDLRYPGVGTNEVQELTISATSGEWFIGDVSALQEHHEFLEHLLPFNASDAEVQKELESADPANNVKVTGGPADIATGRLIGPVSATGNLTEGLATVEGVAKEPFVATGAFAVGQTIEGEGIPKVPATTILKIEGEKLTLSAAIEAGKSGTGVALTGVASSTVEDFTTTGGSTFAVGQEVFSTSVAPGTTIKAIAGTTVTLSLPATETRASAVLSSAPAPYVIALEDQGLVPPIKAESWPSSAFLNGRPCEVLEKFEGWGSCARDPEILKALEGGSKEQPEVKLKSEGSLDGQLVVEAENLGNVATPTECVKVGGLPPKGEFSNSTCTEKQEHSEGEYEIKPTPVTITDTLPAGLTAVAADQREGEGEVESPVGCRLESAVGRPNGSKVTCKYETGKLGIPAYQENEVLIAVRVEPGAHTGEVNTATVSGGGTLGVRTATHPIEVNGTEKFGIENYTVFPENFGGSVATQAGSHPYQVTSVVTANSTYNLSHAFLPADDGKPRTVGLVKDYVGELPAGLVGNPTPFAQCTDAQFATAPPNHEATKAFNECPADSAVGVVLLRYVGNSTTGNLSANAPIFNMVTGPGEPARFAFKVQGLVPVYINAGVRSGSDYGVTLASHDIIQLTWLMGFKLTFWGVPGAKAHDEQRGWECLHKAGQCPESTDLTPPPFLIMPTSCEAPFQSTLRGDSWPYEEHGSETAAPFKYELPYKLTGCNHLPFSPSISVTPDVPDSSTSTGLTADVHVPQTAELNPEGLAESSVRNITVTLPQGVAINPSGGNGLGACSANPGALAAGQLGSPGDQIGYRGNGVPELEPGLTLPSFTSAKPGSFGTEGGEATLQPGLNFCANASKIGEVAIHSPLLPAEQPVKGFVYLASQNANPFGSLLAMYIVAEDPASGTLVKLPGEVKLSASGQIVTTFLNNPELPFEDAILHFFGGEKAPLATPSHCGAYTTTASFEPWSGNPPAAAESTFDITSGPHGGPCPGAQLPFTPSLTGGATNVNAGSFSPFTATMSRKDGEQNLQSLEVKLPPGLSGVLSGVELCPEPAANEGKCGSNSLIGETTVSVGVGGDPFSVEGGKFYLTGPYNGTGACTVGQAGCAPFGITFEVPAKAGPFDLERNSANPAGEDACDCVIVRGKIEINPITAAITITSNPPGTPDAIPTSIEGIPLEIQHVNAITTRSNFQFNPTNCAKMEVTGTIHSSENTTDKIGVPFQVTNCRSLAFTPKFKVSVGAKTSKAKGASLSTTVTEPAGSLGTQANLTKVKVELPKDLPSRLTTLQKACTSKQFEANPAACPSESKIGYAVVHTPLVPVPLEGPAIFVSHGGEAFPSLTMVLQGYGVTIDLVGTTFISKSGVTSTTFKTVPDQPFSSFALTLPTGKYSALTALGNVCKEKLSMPTEFIAQNGAEIHQTTPISVTGCAKTLTRSEKLKAALKACHRDKSKSKRQVCDQLAHRKFGPLKKSKNGRK
jgi:hypothetical protein